MSKRIKILLFLVGLTTTLFAQKPTVECVSFRDGFDKFPLPGTGVITLNSGESIKGEFKQGMTIKMNKWQWHGADGKLHEIKEKDVKRVVFSPDMTFVDKDIAIDVSINIGGKSASEVKNKNLPYNITQFDSFDKKKNYTPLILERVVTNISSKGKETSKLMVLVNHGFDSKYKVYVDLGHKKSEFGKDFQLTDLLFGGGEMGDYYNSFRVVKQGVKESVLIKKPHIIPFVFGKFRNKEFVKLFGDNPDFMSCYPKSFKRKFKYTPEFFWVYDQI